jgi:PEGA domain-containing protein
MRFLWVALCAAALGGCASVTRGTTENISISSNPSGAEATISGLEVPTACITPCAIVAKRSADITVTVAKPGYETEIIPLTKDIPTTGGAAFAGNILLGGLIGMGVDAATGAATDHKPNPLIVTMKPAQTSGPQRAAPRRQGPSSDGAPGS